MNRIHKRHYYCKHSLALTKLRHHANFQRKSHFDIILAYFDPWPCVLAWFHSFQKSPSPESERFNSASSCDRVSESKINLLPAIRSEIAVHVSFIVITILGIPHNFWSITWLSRRGYHRQLPTISWPSEWLMRVAQVRLVAFVRSRFLSYWALADIKGHQLYSFICTVSGMQTLPSWVGRL